MKPIKLFLVFLLFVISSCKTNTNTIEYVHPQILKMLPMSMHCEYIMRYSCPEKVKNCDTWYIDRAMYLQSNVVIKSTFSKLAEFYRCKEKL